MFCGLVPVKISVQHQIGTLSTHVDIVLRNVSDVLLNVLGVLRNVA